MNKTDLLVISMVVLIIFIHLSVVFIQFFSNKFLYLMPVINLVAGLIVFIYWTQKQLSIRQHFFDTREIMVLCFEAIVVGCAVYCIVHRQWNNWLKVYLALQLIFWLCYFQALLHLSFSFNRFLLSYNFHYNFFATGIIMLKKSIRK